MISRYHRFHGYNALTYVYKNGRTIRGPFHAVKFTPSKRGAYRLAVVVSRKVNKSAVRRNRIRRKIYEAVRRLEDKELLPTDIVVTIFDEKIGSLSATELEKLMQDEFIQAGIIIKHQVR